MIRGQGSSCLKPIHRNLSHRCGKCLIDLDAGSDRSKGSVRDGTGTNDIAFPNRAIPQLALANDRKGASRAVAAAKAERPLWVP
jgi:hypothetical protein